MVIEHALLNVTPGQEEAFKQALPLALPIIESAPGCKGAHVRQQVEDPGVFLLLVTWESLEAHAAFRDLSIFEAWRSLTHPFYVEKPIVNHFHEVAPVIN